MPQIYTSPYLPVTVPTNQSLWQSLTRYNVDDSLPQKLILQEYERPERTLTYGDAPRLAALGAAALQQDFGLKSQETIMLIGGNTLDWVAVAHASMWAGIIPACVNPLASPLELEHYISVTKPVIIFCDPEVMKKVAKALELLPKEYARPSIVGIGERGSATATFSQDSVRHSLWKPVPPLNLSAQDNRQIPAIICFSSGTSGKPKAVMISHHTLIATMMGPRTCTPEMFNGRQVEVFFAPLCHIYGVVTALLAPTFTGVHVILMRKYTFRDYITAIAKHRATFLRMLPPTATAMAKDPWVAKQDLTSVEIVGCAGAVLAPEIITRLEELLNGCTIIQGYGLTEGGVSSLKAESARRKPGSVGKLLSNLQVRIVDDNLDDVPLGEAGEILAKGPTIFMCYKNNPEATAEAFPFGDEWRRTGDVGRIDAEGYLYLMDRKKDLIKYKGNQVPPAELEDILLSHPLVTEAGVCAAWDDAQGTEIPVGYVNLSPEVLPSERERVVAEVREYCDLRVAAYKRLRGGLHYLAGFPRNSTGKLLRRELPARKAANTPVVKAKL